MRRFVPGQEPIPGYRLQTFLGRGGFGEVWKAEGPGGIPAAVKFIAITGALGKKEIAALQLMRAIRHTNLVPMFASWFLDENGKVVGDHSPEVATPAVVDTVILPARSERNSKNERIEIVADAVELVIAMGLGEKSLADRLRECRALGAVGIPTDELLDYMEGTARAIDFLNSPIHNLGSGNVSIQHCDIKPLNLLIVGDACQVCDFGLARALGDRDLRATSMGGSPAYSAPECFQNNAPTDSTDQYSLAISYIELRTGYLPFDNPQSLMEVVNAHIHGQLDLSRLSQPEAEVIKRATSLKASDRFPKCSAMVKALRRASEQLQGDASVDSSLSSDELRSGRIPNLATATVDGPTDLTSSLPTLAKATLSGGDDPTTRRLADLPAAGTEASAPPSLIDKDRPRIRRWILRSTAIITMGTVLLAGAATYFRTQYTSECRRLTDDGFYSEAAVRIAKPPFPSRILEDQTRLLNELLPRWRDKLIQDFENGDPRPLQLASGELRDHFPHEADAIALVDELDRLSESIAVPVDQLVKSALLIRKGNDIARSSDAIAFCSKSLDEMKPESDVDLRRDALLLRAAARVRLEQKPFEDDGERQNLARMFSGPSSEAPNSSRLALWSLLQIIDRTDSLLIEVNSADSERSEAALLSFLGQVAIYNTALAASSGDDFHPTKEEIAIVDRCIASVARDDLINAIRVRALAADRDRVRSMQTVDVLLRYRPTDFGLLETKGILQFRDGQFAASAATFSQAVSTNLENSGVKRAKASAALITLLRDLPEAIDGKIDRWTSLWSELEQNRNGVQDAEPEIVESAVSAVLDRIRSYCDVATADSEKIAAYDALAAGISSTLTTSAIFDRPADAAIEMLFLQTERYLDASISPEVRWSVDPFRKDAPLSHVTEWMQAILKRRDVARDRRTRAELYASIAAAHCSPVRSDFARTTAIDLLASPNATTLSKTERPALQLIAARLQSNDEAGRVEAVLRYGQLAVELLTPRRLPVIQGRALAAR